MRQVNVWVVEKGYELPVEEITPRQFDELVNRRVFETLNDVHYTLMALSRGASRYALEHGLACPRDTRKAIEKINALPRY